MKNVHKTVIVLLSTLFVSSLLFFGIEGIWGIVSGCCLLLLVVALLLLKITPPIKEEYHSPLLASVLLIAAAIIALTADYSKMVSCLFLILGLVGIEEIVFWISDKCYKGKTTGELFLDEFRLPPFCDLGFLLYLIYEIINKQISISPIVVFFILFLGADLIRQLIHPKTKNAFWI